MSAAPRALALSLAIAAALAGVAGCNKTADKEPVAADAMALIEPARESPMAPALASRAQAQDTGGEVAGNEVKGLANRNGSQLAYAHDVQIKLEATRVATNLAKAREACTSQKLGPCDVLGEQLTAGEFPSGQLVMRAAPEAVGGLVGLAADGGEVAQRSTHAEDLAQAVADNGLRRKRLELQHAKLSEIMARRDAKVEDLIGLSDRLASIEAELHAAEQESATQQRRIATNLLTLNFQAENVAVALPAETHTRVGEALRNLTSIWDTVAAGLVTLLLGAGLPFAVVVGGAWWLIRRLRRKPATG
jgi:hypothetical protein